MPARLSALLVWALVAASAVAWGLHLFARGPVAPSNTVMVGDGVATGGDLSRLLGTAPVVVAAADPVPAMASRFQLTGVVAPKPPATEGIALIAVDGKLPRAFVVGATIDGDLALRAVDRRSASIGSSSGGAAVVLEMPPLPVAATGVLMPAQGEPPVNTFPPQRFAAPQGQAQTQSRLMLPQQPPQPIQQPDIQSGVQPGIRNQDVLPTEQAPPPQGGMMRQRPAMAR